VTYLYAFFLASALIAIQCLVGGTRPVFAIPAYCLVAVAALLSVGSLRRRCATPSATAVIGTVIFATYVLLRAWFSPYAYLARPDLFMAAACLMVYLLTALYFTESSQRLWLVGVLLAIAVAEVGVGVVQFSRGNGFMLFGFVRNEISSRASGLFICANHLAGYLEAVALFAFSIACWSRWPVSGKLLAAYLTAVCYFGVAITGSRGGYLSSAVSILVFCGLSVWVVSLINRDKVFGRVLVILLSLGLAFGLGGTLMLKSVFVRHRMELLSDSTKDVRRYNWMAALDQFQTSPVVGTGAGTHLIYGRLFRRPQIQSDPVHAHGDYLELLAEYGIIGELLAVVFLFTHIGQGLRAIKRQVITRLRGSFEPPRSNALAINIGAVAAVAALLAHSVVDFNMHIPGNALVFAFIFGLLANPGGANGAEAPAWGSVVMGGRLILPLLGAAMLIGIIPRYRAEDFVEKARIAFRDGRYSDCIGLATKAIDAKTIDSECFFYLGEANRMIGMRIQRPAIRKIYMGKAIEAYRKGLAILPHDENLWIRLGQALDGAARFSEADAAYQEAIRWDPNLGYLYGYYGAHFRMLSQEAASKRCYEAARQLGAERASELGMGEVRSLLELDPSHADSANARNKGQ